MHIRIGATIGALIFAFANGLTIAARSQPLSTVDRSIAVNASPGGVLQPKSRSTTASNLVTNAERLSIKVLGYAELTGEYRLNSDETISLPVIGRVSISSMTLVELERELTERVSRITNREAYVNVEVVEYKPVFVSGAVTRPGPAPWKPGMTVLHALTLTGDLLKSPELAGRRYRGDTLGASHLRAQTCAGNACSPSLGAVRDLCHHGTGSPPRNCRQERSGGVDWKSDPYFGKPAHCLFRASRNSGANRDHGKPGIGWIARPVAAYQGILGDAPGFQAKNRIL